MGDFEQASRHDAQDYYQKRDDDQDCVEEVDFHMFREYYLFLFFGHVHDDDHSEIVVEGDDCCDDGNDDHPEVASLDAVFEDVEFGKESAHGGDSGHGYQKDRHCKGDDGMLSREPFHVFNEEPFVLFLCQKDCDSEGPHIHQDIYTEIKEERRSSTLSDAEETDQHIPHLRDSRIGQHSDQA